MAVSDIEAVLDFLRKNGFTEAESAFREDIVERGDFGSFDLEKFEFPMSPRPPPVRIFLAHGRSEVSSRVDGSVSSSDSSEDFLSVCSSTTNGSPSGFTNPYGLMSAARVKSDASSDILSEFGTARNYHDSDILNDMYWCDEKDGGGYVKYPGFGGTDFFNCPSEDKFVTTSEAKWLNEKPFGLNVESEGFHSVTSINFLEKPYIFHNAAIDSDHLKTLKEPNLGETQLVHVGEIFSDYDSTLENKRSVSSVQGIERGSANNFNGEEFQKESDLHLQDTEKSFQSDGNDGFDIEDGGETVEELHEPGNEEECGIEDELPMYDNHEDEYEVFNLRIIHRKNRTGFEENKDLPIVLNSIIAGRYYVTEYLGSAAFSKVIQAHDLQTGIDVCLKIIKNDKDFFDQSLDEIKLLKMVNKHDPGDKHHILRLYDYFYHQEHLFIVCELLRANLYEFQKFNQESGGEVYFTSRRLQLITRQCLEALDYLHNLGIIHCDLKPENILIKSYSRCEIKIIDLGSSCFQMDNLCLYVQSRSYRAPEVILGLPYDQKIDIWSLGCILAELCSGDVLFPNDGLVMLLARMIGMLGPIDMEMLVRGQETYKYFTKEYDLYHLNEETNQLEYIIPEQSSLEYRLQVSDIGFVGFVKDLLETNPNRRPTAAEALRHPWLSYPYE